MRNQFFPVRPANSAPANHPLWIALISAAALAASVLVLVFA